MNLNSSFYSQKEPFESGVSYEEQKAAHMLAIKLISIFPDAIITRPIIFVCIGTDRSTGDSLGPLVGTLLKGKILPPFYVYGTLEEPIHAMNLEEQLQIINSKHFNPIIIAIDACLGRLKRVGMIQIADGPIKPGAGVKKDLPEVGDFHITGIVNVSGFMEFFVLQNTRLSIVLNMATVIANAIQEASATYHSEKPLVHLMHDWEREQST